MDFRRHLKAGALTVVLLLVSCWYAVFAPFAPGRNTEWNWEVQNYRNGYVLGRLNSIISRSNGLSDDNVGRMNEYLSSVRLTDDFIYELRAWVSGSDRDVIVYMVGDHCPPMINSLTDESSTDPEHRSMCTDSLCTEGRRTSSFSIL